MINLNSTYKKLMIKLRIFKLMNQKNLMVIFKSKNIFLDFVQEVKEKFYIQNIKKSNKSYVDNFKFKEIKLL